MIVNDQEYYFKNFVRNFAEHGIKIRDNSVKHVKDGDILLVFNYLR